MFAQARTLRAIVMVLVIGLCAGPAAADELRRFRSAAYDISTDLPDDQAREVADHMDAISVEYTRRFSAYGKRNAQPLRLWVFATREGYMEFLAGHGVNAMGTGGMFFRTGSASGLASFLGNRPMEIMLQTLRHEGLHQVVYQRIGGEVPAWLNEGMAEWFSYALPARRGFVTGLADPAAVRRLKAAEANGGLIPLQELLTMSKSDWNARVTTGAAGAQYDQAWSVVHFLAHGENGQYQHLLDALVRAFWTGMNDDQAIRTVLGNDLAPMDATWQAFVRQLEPDELYAGQNVLTAYRIILTALDGMDVRPGTLEHFEAALSEHATRLAPPALHTEEPGIPPVTLDADAWWRALPTSARTGRAATVRFTPDRRGRLPPAVELRGLKNRMTLEWSRASDGTLSGTVVID